MADMREEFPSKYLRPSDFEEEKTVTIKGMVKEQVLASLKPVVYFQGYDKALVLNKTNNDSIMNLHGYESNGWKGKQVIIYPSTVNFQGKDTPCLRIRGVKTSKPTQPVPEEEMNDALPF